MPARLVCLVAVALCAELLAGCASRPVNAPITEINRDSGYRFGTRQLHDRDRENLVVAPAAARPGP